MQTKVRRHDLSFRPRARLVSILGEHLISDQAVGLIELVKNAYDADATKVSVELLSLSQPHQTSMTVTDNGCGMTIEDIQLKWLSPAVDHKERDKLENRRTPLGRLPIGEKGVGRFAVHQLGRRLEMVTRSRGKAEVVVNIDWDAYDDGDSYLDGMPVEVIEREPETFAGDWTGTRIRVSNARTPWNDKLVRKVHRTLRRLQSPLAEDNYRFRVRLTCPEHPELENIDPTDILQKAHYEFRALVSQDGKCDLEYICKHPAVSGREEAEEGVDLVSMAREELQDDIPRCGPFWVNLYVWDRTRDHLQASDVSSRELDAQCGVSLFRDGLRVLPYGEPGDDWLLLDQERIQAPAERIGNNQVIGLVQFDQSSNLLLRDKTNREGLIENEAFLDLRALIRAAIRQFTKYWRNDRPQASKRISNQRSGDIRGAHVVATALKETARDDVEVSIPENGIPAAYDPAQPSEEPTGNEDGSPSVVTQRRAVELLIEHIRGAEDDSRDRDHKLDLLLQLAGTGLAAERVVHEFGKHVVAASDSIQELRRAARRDKQIQAALAALETLRSEFRILAPYEMIGTPQRARKVSVSESAELALELNRGLLSDQQIESTVEGDDWSLVVKPTPLLQILDNLVHNACSWVSTVASGEKRRLGILLAGDESKILVADTGPGVDEETAPHIFDPFFTMKSGGKGLGLYISSELSSKLGVGLRLADSRDIHLVPAWATGAVFVLDTGSATHMVGQESQEQSNG